MYALLSIIFLASIQILYTMDKPPLGSRHAYSLPPVPLTPEITKTSKNKEEELPVNKKRIPHSLSPINHPPVKRFTDFEISSYKEPEPLFLVKKKNCNSLLF